MRDAGHEIRLKRKTIVPLSIKVSRAGAGYSFYRAIGEPLWQSNFRVGQDGLINGQPVFDSKRSTPESEGGIISTRAGRTDPLQCHDGSDSSITPTALHCFKITSWVQCRKDTTKQSFEVRPVLV